jgi:hypothetical protein
MPNPILCRQYWQTLSIDPGWDALAKMLRLGSHTDCPPDQENRAGLDYSVPTRHKPEAKTTLRPLRSSNGATSNGSYPAGVACKCPPRTL